MLQFYFYSFFLAVILSFSSSQDKKIEKGSINLVPLPQEIDIKSGDFEIDHKTVIVYSDDSLKFLSTQLASRLVELTGHNLQSKKGTVVSECKIHLLVDPTLSKGSYNINVDKYKVEVKGSSYRSVAFATSTLVQLLKIDNHSSTLPCISIHDYADFSWRTVMLDLARRWHPIKSLEETIDLLQYYKIPTLHLHLSDNRLFTMETKHFPKLLRHQPNGDRMYYTQEELKELVEFARLRGVTIVPEIDLPGHSGIMWQTYPEVFGGFDTKGKEKALYIVNMANQKCYDGLELLIEEIASIFSTSPYIHVGGDEVYLQAITEIPDYKSFCKEHNLQVSLDGDPNELFAYFLVEMDRLIQKHGKKTILWEGFHGTGAGRIEIPKEIPVVVWNSTFNSPKDLCRNGYSIVNAMWVPNYLCGAMNFAPEVESAFDWQAHIFKHWKGEVEDITMNPDSARVKGGQICFWEQNYNEVVPTLKDRLPGQADRWWNYSNEQTFSDFALRLESVDTKISQILRPINSSFKGLVNESENTFTEKLVVDLSSKTQGEIRYRLDEDWGNIDVDRSMEVYDGSFTVNESCILTAQLFSKDNVAIGYPYQMKLQKIDPIFSYEAFGGSPHKGWPAMPDINSLPLVQNGLLGRVDDNRFQEINRDLFAKVKRLGHIDTRPYGLLNPFALRIKGKVRIPDSGNYEFKMLTWDGLANVTIGEERYEGKDFVNKQETFSLALDKGEYPIVIEYYYRYIQNQLNIVYVDPADGRTYPLEDLMMDYTK